MTTNNKHRGSSFDTYLADSDTDDIIWALTHRAQSMNVTDLAKECGVSRAQIYDMMKGKTIPRLDNAVRLAKAMNLRLILVAI